MNKINIKSIFRNLIKGKFYTLINILGLAVGMTAMVWAIQDIRFGTSFNDFHPQGDKIYRVITKNKGSDLWNGYCPMPVAEYAEEQFSNIEKSIRWQHSSMSIKAENKDTRTSKVYFTDPSFFQIFNFPVKDGKNDLNDQSAVLITDREAKKLFGDENPIGKTIQLYVGEKSQMPLIVTGILENVPNNSSIHFDILTNIKNLDIASDNDLQLNDWSLLADAIFFKVKESAPVDNLNKSLQSFIPLASAGRKDIKISEFKLEPLSQIANHEADMGANELFVGPGKAGLYGPLVLALLILLSACLNFANTTVSRSNLKLKEMGVRKVLGGTKMQLITQQLIESGIIVFFALCLSTLFTSWWLPTFNSMFTGIELHANYLQDFALLKYMGLILLLVTLIAGLYPAYYVARFNPTQIFRGGFSLGGNNLFSRILLGLQISIAFITISASIGFAKNAKFQRDFNFGFDQNNVLGVVVTGDDYLALRDAVAKIPDVEMTAGSIGHLGYSWEKKTIEAEGVVHEINYMETGNNYLDLMGVQLLSGRNFNDENESDIGKSIIISENLCTQYGWTKENALGKQLRSGSLTYSVIGVSKDLYIDGFLSPIAPLAFAKVAESNNRLLLVKSKSVALENVYGELQSSWNSLLPLKPFNAFYQNELGSQVHRVNASITTIFSWFAIVSILLTLTGMSALISLTILKKNKEIAIRRVIGASLKNIAIVINKSYFIIFIVASALGMYAGASLTQLMMDLTFRVNVGFNFDSLIVTFLGVCLMVMTVVILKILQVNRMKPSVVLKGN